MGIKFEKLTVKNIVFLAVMAALLFLCGAIAMPFMTITLFGLRNLITAPFYALFATITVMKVRKPGALSLLGIFNGAILFMMSPVMFITTSLSAVIAEFVALLIFKSYQTDKAILTATILWMPLTLPFTALFSVILNGQSFSEVIGFSPYVILTCLGTVALSFVGAFIGKKIGGELKKAGKMN